MISTIVEIIGIACFGYIFASVITPMLKLKVKPFTCESCLAWWIALIWFYPLGLTAILYAAISYTIAGLIWKL